MGALQNVNKVAKKLLHISETIDEKFTYTAKHVSGSLSGYLLGNGVFDAVEAW